MSPDSKSALRVQYDLRPAKQVERRMLADAFQHLAQEGFAIRDYQYTGFGALQFVDHYLFHKLLGISNMLSIEHDPKLEDRIKFNRPFDCVQVEIGAATDVVPRLSMDTQHILWLDYDCPVTREVAKDLYLAGSQLSRASILIATVDVEPPNKDRQGAQDNRAYFQTEVPEYIGTTNLDSFTKANLPAASARVLLNAIKEGMAGRPGVEFHLLFHFAYADGHRMLTIGGMIGTSTEKRQLRGLDEKKLFFLRRKLESGPYEIKVPVLTRKERLFLDRAMPCSKGWQPDDFKLPPDDLMVYSQIYRFLPAYAELLV